MFASKIHVCIFSYLHPFHAFAYDISVDNYEFNSKLFPLGLLHKTFTGEKLW